MKTDTNDMHAYFQKLFGDKLDPFGSAMPTPVESVRITAKTPAQAIDGYAKIVKDCCEKLRE